MNIEQDGTTTVSKADGKHPSRERVLFINMGNGSEPTSASTRKKARSHIMSRYHKQLRESRGIEKSTHFAPGSLTSRVTPKERISEKEQSQLEYTSSAPRSGIIDSVNDVSYQGVPSPAKYLQSWNPFHGLEEMGNCMPEQQISSSTNIDPFDTISFPFQLDHRDRNLLFHYNTVFNYSNIPVNSRLEWVAFAVTDSALLHTTLIISALHVALLRGKEFSVDAFRHQRQAVRILSERLEDPILSCLDPTILAISCLALIEVLNASPLGAKPHVDTLVKLVNHRGGLDKLGFNGIVKRKVLWADLSNAIAQQTLPRFPFFSNYLSIACPLDRVPATDTTLTTNICTEILDWVKASQLPPGIDIVMHDLQYLSSVLTLADRTKLAEVDHLMLSDRFYSVERRAYDLLRAERSYPLFQATMDASDTIIPSPNMSLYRACCLAAIIYVSFALREIPPRAGIFNPLLERLTAIVKHIDFSIARISCPKTVLWILGTGGAVTSGRKERRLYVKLLDEFFGARDISEWKVAKKETGSFIHLPPRYMEEYLDIWNDVEELRMMRDFD